MPKFYPDNDRPYTLYANVPFIPIIETPLDWIVMQPPRKKLKDNTTPTMWGAIIASAKEQRYVTCCLTFKD